MYKRLNHMENQQIFIIDDSPIQLILLEKVLKRADYSVRVFNNGYSLINSLEVETPDLMISDIDMPNLNGFELVEEVKNQFGCVDFPFFYISSSWNKRIEKKAEELGAALLIEKPFKIEVLMEQIKKELNPTIELDEVDLPE